MEFKLKLWKDADILRPRLDLLVNGVIQEFQVDTGADRSVVDETLLTEKTKMVKARDYRGNIEWINLYKVTIRIDEKDFDCEVFPRSGGVNLLGMDILQQCDFMMIGGVMILETR